MAIPHAQPGDVISARPLGTDLSAARSHALFKSADLELIRVVLPAGQDMPAHAVAGALTLHCIEGQVAVVCDAGERRLGPGELIYLAGGERHALTGIEDASLLLTIALKRGPDGTIEPAAGARR